MDIWNYARRAYAELTGRPAKQSSHFLMSFVVIVAILIGILVFNLVAWGTRNENKQQDLSCAFRITEKDAPPPVTEGDAAQLNTCVQLELVASESRRRLGLSNRPSMPWHHGMLFDFERKDEYCMWMKDMHFSLDMLWLNETFEIVGLRENVSPDTYPQSFCGPKTARYVVEVNAGVVQAGDLHLGQHLSLQEQ